MKRIKFWIIFSLVIVFIAGAVGGIFCERYLVSKKWGARKRASFRPHSFQELNLTSDQEGKIKAIFKENDVRIRELRSDYYKRLGEIRSQLKSEVDKVLTPEQKQKLESMIQKFRGQRRREYEEREKKLKEQPKDNPMKEKEHEKEDYHRSSNSDNHYRSHPGICPF
ncbi:MAG: hypothetical protein WCC06_04565 [Candidatus Aminicenantales bacterium]